jgi:hypothetical protein
MNREAFRDDLVAQRVAIFGYDPGVGASTDSFFRSRREPVTLAEAAERDVQQRAHFQQLADAAKAEGKTYFSLGGRCSGKTIAQWCKRGEYEHMWLDEAAEITLPTWLSLEAKPASSEQRAARMSGIMTVTIDLPSASPANRRSAIRTDENLADLLSNIRSSDAPGIAAMAAKSAKSVKPTPEPILSIAGEQGTAAEFAEALLAIRAKNAPPVKEAPRGLMVVADMDHRLGLWNRG